MLLALIFTACLVIGILKGSDLFWLSMKMMIVLFSLKLVLCWLGLSD